MPILYTISEITVVGINFFKKPKWHVLIASIACIVNIFGNWVLVPLYGALGASVSTAFSYIVFFVLRTQISQIYYKINYNLYKTYLMLMIISAYALFSVITNSFYHNILVGMIVLLALVIFYIKDVKMGYKTLKNLKAFDKIKRN
jgi:O-antigen/teichoic acid export membrane protein